MKSLLILKSHIYLTRLQGLWHKIKENDIKNAGKGIGMRNRVLSLDCYSGRANVSEKSEIFILGWECKSCLF